MFEETHREFQELNREAFKQIVALEDKRLLGALIGSKILDFKLTKIPNRKTTYELYIRTDAPPVPCLDFNFDNNRLEIVESPKAFSIPSEIRLRVKL